MVATLLGVYSPVPVHKNEGASPFKAVQGWARILYEYFGHRPGLGKVYRDSRLLPGGQGSRRS